MIGMKDSSPSCEDDICALPPVSASIEPELELKSEDPEELLALFEANGCGDGLPLVAPTEERVEAMLTAGGGLETAPPDEVIATLPRKQWDGLLLTLTFRRFRRQNGKGKPAIRRLRSPHEP